MTAVVLISVVGTLVTDSLSDNFGVPLEISTLLFSVLLAATFAVWFALERTLSIHTIYTGRREALYWLAILFTFALGTIAGDLVAEKLQLGYLNTGLLFGAIIVVQALLMGLRMGGAGLCSAQPRGNHCRSAARQRGRADRSRTQRSAKPSYCGDQSAGSGGHTHPRLGRR